MQQEITPRPRNKLRGAAAKAYKGMPSPNPKGYLGTGFQHETKRIDHLRQKYSASEILEIVADPKKLDKFSSIDRIAARHLANIYAGDGLERERLYDRAIGKVKDKIDINLGVFEGTNEERMSRLSMLAIESGVTIEGDYEEVSE